MIQKVERRQGPVPAPRDRYQGEVWRTERAKTCLTHCTKLGEGAMVRDLL